MLVIVIVHVCRYEARFRPFFSDINNRLRMYHVCSVFFYILLTIANNAYAGSLARSPCLALNDIDSEL